MSETCVQVVEGSPLACQATCKRLLPPLATAVSDAQSIRQEHGQYHKPHKTEQLALSAVLGIVKAAVKAAAANVESTTRDQMSSGNNNVQTVNGHDEEDGEDPLAGTGASVFEAVTGGQRQRGQGVSHLGGNAASVGGYPGKGLVGEGLAGGVGGKSGGDAEMSDSAAATQDQSMQQLAGKVKGQSGMSLDYEGGDDGQDEIELLRLQVLTELVSFPAASSPLSAQVCYSHPGPLYSQTRLLQAVYCCKHIAAVFWRGWPSGLKPLHPDHYNAARIMINFRHNTAACARSSNAPACDKRET